MATSANYSLRPPDSKGPLCQSACSVGGTVLVPPLHAAAALYSSMNARLSTRAIYMPDRCGKLRVASEPMRKLKVTFVSIRQLAGSEEPFNALCRISGVHKRQGTVIHGVDRPSLVPALSVLPLLTKRPLAAMQDDCEEPKDSRTHPAAKMSKKTRRREKEGSKQVEKTSR